MDKPTVSNEGGPSAIRRVSMRQVAQVAGVTAQTVSKVVNQRPGVSAEVRTRIEAIMHELNYRPNVGARWLKTGVAASIGLINGERPSFGQSQVVHGVERAARQGGYYSTVAGLASTNAASLQESIDRLVSMSVAGIIINVPVATGSHTFDDLHADIPLVGIWVPTESPFPVATYNHRAAGLMATRHLLALGHKTVHHLGGNWSHSGADQRAAGWRDALAEVGAPVHNPAFGDWSAQSGYELGRELAARLDVTAVFAANDAMALGLIRALHEAGRAVPDDVSVVGYDDLPEAAFYNPPLTTVRQDFLALGERAYTLLAAQMRHDDAALVPSSPDLELILRASTAPPGGPSSRPSP